jgi:hypothetical protein
VNASLHLIGHDKTRLTLSIEVEGFECWRCGTNKPEKPPFEVPKPLKPTSKQDVAGPEGR